MKTPQRPIERTIPDGGQARELHREVLTDIAIIEHQVAKVFGDRHKQESIDEKSSA